ncbi:MAG: hypothetical protein Q4D41_08600, partial [Prevotellaceae bacterium]|nr:hypothetical protein [Prevotellaceae bacterium]
ESYGLSLRKLCFVNAALPVLSHQQAKRHNIFTHERSAYYNILTTQYALLEKKKVPLQSGNSISTAKRCI